MKLGEYVQTIPTIGTRSKRRLCHPSVRLCERLTRAFECLLGFNVESVKYKNISFDCWDAGGQEKVRKT